MSDDIPRDEVMVDRPGESDVRLWSVTTIIDQSSSSRGLVEWAKGEVARAAVHQQRTVQALIEDSGPDAAIGWLIDATERGRKGQRSAKQLGTDVHRACEEYAISGERPEVDSELVPFLDRFDEWCQHFQPVYEAAEMTVYHPEFGYAGTLDAVFKVGDVRAVVDYKVTARDKDDKGRLRTPWSDVGLQLAAYRHAQFAAAWRPVRNWSYYSRRYYLLGDAEREAAVPLPEVDGGLCLHITPARCTAYPVRCDNEVFEAFCYAIERSRWALEMSKTVLGPPLEEVHS